MAHIEVFTKEEQESNCAEMANLAEKTLGKPCKECNGSGHGAWNLTFKTYELCDCVLKAQKKIRKQMVNEKLPHIVTPEENN
jgi:hypothetical protein